MKKSDKGVKEIKDILNRFQKEYDRKDIEHIDDVVREFFIDEEDISFVGTGVKDWNFGINEISDTLNSYWLNGSKFLKNIQLDVDNSIITIEGNTAVAALCGKSMRKIEKEKMFDEMMMKIK
ncbi:MAG: hypothetical protein K0R09_1702 [Clostridiales bacterium]|nr:hypothetical protein [Clostridiales bacterium]